MNYFGKIKWNKEVQFLVVCYWLLGKKAWMDYSTIVYYAELKTDNQNSGDFSTNVLDCQGFGEFENLAMTSLTEYADHEARKT